MVLVVSNILGDRRRHRNLRHLRILENIDAFRASPTVTPMSEMRILMELGHSFGGSYFPLSRQLCRPLLTPDTEMQRLSAGQILSN